MHARDKTCLGRPPPVLCTPRAVPIFGWFAPTLRHEALVWVCHMTRWQCVIALNTYGLNGLRPLSFPASLGDRWCGGTGKPTQRCMFWMRGGRAMPCGAAGQCLANRRCCPLSFVESVAGCEPHVCTIDVHRFITVIIFASTSFSAIIIITTRIHV